MAETITGQIERVTYHNADSGFAVLRVRVRGWEDLVTVIGTTASLTAGEHLEATGHWTIDRQHGQQFRALDLRTAHPASAEGIERYLASGAIRGIGPQLARRIVRHFREQSLEVIGREPDRLLEIHGIGDGRLRKIGESWQEQKEVRQIMLFLAGHGIGSGRAVRIYRTYGQQAIPLIKTNPYQLADDIRGIGFRTADELARKLGLDAQSPHRARAAVRYVLQQLAGEGHCGCAAAEVVRRTVELAAIQTAVVEQAVETAVAEGVIIREWVGAEAWLYLGAIYRAEAGLAHAVRALACVERHPLPAIDIERALVWVEQRLAIELSAGQKEAVRLACQHKLLVITGGPGVGKTMLVRAILEIFAAKGLRCILAAPTGRAAKRLTELTGRAASTLHRLLEFDPRQGEFQRNPQRPLAGDLFVLDETSMVDAVLGYQFLRAVPPQACVILVGDVDQLPSVGPGAVLADLIASETVPVARLTEVFRQARHSHIIQAAHAINQGRMPALRQAEGLGDFYFVAAERPEAIQSLVVRLVRERIPARFGLDAVRDIQVLTPMNRSLLGTRSLNVLLQNALNPSRGEPEVERYGWTFRPGDRVLQTENNYERDVFNGDLGMVARINRIEQQLVVNFEGREVTYDFGDLDELSLAYAMSIHKSQGSEFPCIVVPLHAQHYLMLQRNLLYTAVTRGKRLVVLVGSERALALAVGRANAGQRHTTLLRRLQGE